MRRSLTTIASAALLLSSVGSVFGGEPLGSPAPTPIVERVGSNAVASGDPGPASGPVPSTAPRLSPDGAAAPIAATTESAIATPHGARAATDPTNRWIVQLVAGTDPAAAADREGRRIGFRSDRLYRNAFLGYSATLDRAQVTALSHDPSVAMIVPDEKISVTGQLIPTGISRMGATRSPVAGIDGVDQRVDADVAIVDTGISRVPDLNVAGGYNCSTGDRTAWRDLEGHGTHVAGTVGAIDNGSGVVGVAPGVRLWAVKILDDNGDGLLSWYVCGLDWIAAQRDPIDPTRPRFEAVNMSVAKWGTDDRNCGSTNKDVLHAAICRLVASGVTVVAAAGNDSANAAYRVPAAYDEVITVSALADTDGKPGGLGGNRCLSWGSYDSDDTFADFSNWGGDVDLIAPGKCIWSTIPSGYGYSSGTSMAAPHVTGAVALLKASRPGLSPAEVREALIYLGNLGWKTSSDPDTAHERLLDVSRIGPRGDFSIAAGANGSTGEAGGAARVPLMITRTTTSFERIRFVTEGLPAGATASFSPGSIYGFGNQATTLVVTIPFGTRAGAYPVTVTAYEHGNVRSTVATIDVRWDLPTAHPPTVVTLRNAVLGTSVPSLVSWPPATDPTTAIAGYEMQLSVDGGPWGTTIPTSAGGRSLAIGQRVGHTYAYQVRARDGVGNWSAWAAGPATSSTLVEDRAASIVFAGWIRIAAAGASGGSTTYTTKAGARARTTFSGRGIALVASVAPGRGSAGIYVDGVLRANVSFNAATARSRVVLYATSFSAVGNHTFEVRASGTGRVDLDALVVLR